MIVWLASYPKSGNTLLRGILSSYFFSKDGVLDFNNLYKIGQFPCISQFKAIEINTNDDAEVFKNYIKAQENINENIKKTIFLKTHSAFCKIENSNFTNLKNSLGVIYVIRDPRNLVNSLAYHNQVNVQTATNILINNHWLQKDNIITKTFVGSWKFNYLSWKKFGKKNLIIKYEDLINHKEDTILEIINFLKKLKIKNLEIDYTKIKKIIETTEFDYMKKLEKKKNFNESVIDNLTGEKKPFFNLGPNNQYKKNLDNRIVEIIEKEFKTEMKELGYI
jgi:hypothetical protein